MTKKTMEQQNKYGHLLDKYLDNVHRRFSSRQECEEEARRRYGNLVDHMKSDNKIYDDIMSVGDMRRRIRQQREDVYEQENIRRQERIEREKKKEQERIEKNNSFVNSYLKKKEAEQKAAEEKRKEAKRKQDMLDSIQRMIYVKDEISGMISSTNAMLKRDKQHRKEHEEKMEWYRQQHKE